MFLSVGHLTYVCTKGYLVFVHNIKLAQVGEEIKKHAGNSESCVTGCTGLAKLETECGGSVNGLPGVMVIGNMSCTMFESGQDSKRCKYGVRI